MPDTSSRADQVWARDNQRHLTLLTAAVTARLDARPADADDQERAAAMLAGDVRAAIGRPVAVERLAALFSLTRFERDILVAAAAPEIGHGVTAPVTFARALSCLPDAHWSALLPDAPLRHWRLLDVPAHLPPAESGGLSQVPLAVDERLLHALLGADTLDERLAGRARVAAPACRLTPAQAAVATELAALVVPAPAAAAAIVAGEDRLTRRQAAIDAAAAAGLTVLMVESADLPDDAPTADLFARMLAREAALGARLIVVEAVPGLERRSWRLVTSTASAGVPVVLSADEPEGGTELPVLRLPAPTVADRKALFAATVSAAGLDADAGALAASHPLTAAGIALAVDRAARLARAHGGGAPDLAASCRAVAERPLSGLAEFRRPTARLSGLVLPEAAERALRALLAHVRQRDRVHGDWGYGDLDRGLAVTALFAGPSGTGKTTAAEAVAAELGLDLIAADLSQVVSKYIGETEKNLAALFAAAESGAVLLFDEGDALFGKRTQVRDSRDRYANLEISYLLQRLETFRGIAIVTTNVREAVDTAFTRRMRFLVTFGFPDTGQRATLWRRAFPPGVPTDGLDPVRLAQLAVGGGTIAQLAVHAAFLAADAGEPVRMSHVLEAARIECDKLERPLSAQETRGWS
jgi:ATPase family associated with various cellular activities (AAA)